MANRLNGPALTYERASGTGAERRKRIIDIHMARAAADRRRHPTIAPRGFEAVTWLALAMAFLVPLALALMPLWAPHH